MRRHFSLLSRSSVSSCPNSACESTSHIWSSTDSDARSTWGGVATAGAGAAGGCAGRGDGTDCATANGRDAGTGFSSGAGTSGDQACGERLPTPIARYGLEFHSYTRGRFVRVAVEYRCVQKDILAASVRRDKSVTAFLVELQYLARNQSWAASSLVLCRIASTIAGAVIGDSIALVI
jgi:hypothetical protein